MESSNGHIAWVSLTGDFFFYPAQRLADLEAALVGVRLDETEPAIARFYAEQGVESPGVTPADFAQVLG